MKKLIIMALALVAGTLAIGATASAQEEPDDTPKVTICHAAGLDGTTKYVTITVGYPAAYGEAGHFYENGTTQAGHEDDYLGECKVDETTTTTTVEETTTTTAATTTTTVTPTTAAPTTAAPTTAAPTVTPAIVVPAVVATAQPPAPASRPPAVATPAPPRALPSTGSETTVMGVIAALMTVLGGAAIWAARRKSALDS